MRAALVAICPKGHVDDFLKRIESFKAYTTLKWSHSFTEQMEDEIQDTIASNGYARVFFYERKGTGGEGIRLAAHVEDMEDIEDLNLVGRFGKIKTRFRVVGYEKFEPVIDISAFKHLITGNTLHPRTIASHFGLVEDIDTKGVPLSIFCRMKWNNERWETPSGPTLPGKHLMASEEWNLNTEDSVNGYIYAYFNGRPKGFEEGQPFPIHLWSETPDGEYVLVARYEKAETVTEEELNWVDSYFERSGIYERRAESVLETYSEIDDDWENQEKKD